MSLQGVVPVVPAAVIFDLGRAGHFDRRPDPDVRSASDRFGSGPPAFVGIGRRRNGCPRRWAAGWRRHREHHRRRPRDPQSSTPAGACRCGGAIAVVNANGSVIDPATAPAVGVIGRSHLRRPTRPDRRRLLGSTERPGGQPEHHDRGGGDLGGAVEGRDRRRWPTSHTTDSPERFGRPTRCSTVTRSSGWPPASTISVIAPSRDALDDRRARARSTSSCTPARDTFAAACVHAVAGRHHDRRRRRLRATLCPSAAAAPAVDRTLAATSVARRGHRHRLPGSGARMVGRHPAARPNASRSFPRWEHFTAATSS